MIEPKWTDQQQEHIAWCATPKPLRDPSTKQLWAEKLGVNPRTLNRWEKLPGFRAAVSDQALHHVWTDLPEVLSALVETAKRSHTTSSVTAQRMVLEYLKELMPEGSPTVNVTFTADDFARAEAEIRDWLAGRPH